MATVDEIVFSVISLDKKTIGRVGWVLFACLAIAAQAGQRQFVQGHLASAISLQPIGRLPASNRLDIAFGLPLRHRQSLTNLLSEIYRPGSPSFHHYLTPDQFAANFGPTEADYQAVMGFARAHNLKITRTHSNRTLLDVNGTVADIEEAFHVHLCIYQHPTENRTFFAPDARPSVDLATPVLVIDGLHNDTLLHPNVHPSASPAQTGSGTNGSFLGMDFRAAYLPGVNLIGTRQTVGLFEVDGFHISDITNYETLASLTNFVTVTSNLIDGYSGAANGGLTTVECCLDIEMAIAMAPGLSRVVVYEGSPYAPTVVNDILNCMATNDAASQLSSSYTFDMNAATDQIFQQFALQGQTYFNASGDTNAYVGPVEEPTDDPNITIVGGTSLTTTGPLGSWVSETTWNEGGNGSSGGISVVIPIPVWQQGINMSFNQGSTNLRNVPDVALVAENVMIAVNGGTRVVGGTSCGTPLWAGLTALVNEEAALNGQPPLGFANPTIYAIGESSSYTNCFHDITTGDNFWADSPTNYSATNGYDLCTGWGTPNGSNLLAALLAPLDALMIAPPLGFTAIGLVGGPFGVVSQNYLLTNAGNVGLNWSSGVTPPWLTLSSSSGALAPGAGTSVTVALNAAASNMLMGDYSGSISFTNLQDNVTQTWPFALLAGNGGFESGNLFDWRLSGDGSANTVVCIDDADFEGEPWAGVIYEEFVHSGLCGAYLGQTGSLGSMSQSVPTVAGQYYLFSCWFRSFAYSDGSTAPNEFAMKWNGTTLFDQTNMGAFNWTNLQYIVMASGPATALEFDFRDDPAALALDDITMQAVPTPIFQTVTETNHTVSFTWNALSNLVYQLQYTTSLNGGVWSNVGVPIVASNNIVITLDTNLSDPQRFYRFNVSP